MSYRYNTIDIIVGVGMCAILFGALLLFVAVNGTYHAIPPQGLAAEQSAVVETGMRAILRFVMTLAGLALAFASVAGGLSANVLPGYSLSAEKK